MFAEDMRRAVMAAPPAALPELSSALWKAFAAGEVTEADADVLSRLVEARRAVPPPPTRKPAGARPRTPESLARRRRWTASGWLPPRVAASFTPAEAATLSVVAWRCARAGRCALPIGHLAALAGVGRTKVKDALRRARELGLLRVEERRRKGARSETNLVTVACPEWSAWLAVVRSPPVRGGVGKATATSTKDIPPATKAAGSIRQGLPGRKAAAAQARTRRPPAPNGWGGEGRRPAAVPCVRR